jgi:hypothetical protein
MRRVAFGLTLLMLGCFAIAGWANPGNEQQALQATPPAVKPLVLSDGFIALSSDTADGQQQITVIDTKTRVMAVYHAAHKSGVITLKSVRNISADLMLDDFNTDSPLPREIRAILSKR